MEGLSWGKKSRLLVPLLSMDDLWPPLNVRSADEARDFRVRRKDRGLSTTKALGYAEDAGEAISDASLEPGGLLDSSRGMSQIKRFVLVVGRLLSCRRPKIYKNHEE